MLNLKLNLRFDKNNHLKLCFLKFKIYAFIIFMFIFFAN